MKYMLKVMFAGLCLPVLCASALAAPYQSVNPVKVVLFPLRRSVIPAIVDGVIIKYNFKQGEAFSKDNVIAELDDRIYQQQYDKALADNEERKANRAYAEENYKNTNNLYQKGFQGEPELKKSKLEFEISKSKLKQSEAELKLAELKLDACKVKAPFNGRVVAPIVREFEFVRAGTAFLDIIQDDVLLAAMHLPSELKNQIKVGDVAEVKVDETGTTHSGKIYIISGEVDAGSRTFEVKVLVENRDEKLAAGMSGALLKINAIKLTPVKEDK